MNKQYKYQWVSNTRQNYEDDCGSVVDHGLIECGT